MAKQMQEEIPKTCSKCRFYSFRENTCVYKTPTYIDLATAKKAKPEWCPHPMKGAPI